MRPAALFLLIFALTTLSQPRRISAQSKDTLIRLEYSGLRGSCTIDELNPAKYEANDCVISGSNFFLMTNANFRNTPDTIEIVARMVGTQYEWYEGTFKVTMLTPVGGVIPKLWVDILERRPAQRGGSSSGTRVELRDAPIQWITDSSAEVLLDRAELPSALVGFERGNDFNAGVGGWTRSSSFIWSGELEGHASLRLWLPGLRGIEDVSKPDLPLTLLLFPNPASDVVYYQSPDTSSTVSLVDQLGRTFEVEQGRQPLMNLNVSSLPSGLYWAIQGNNRPTKLIVRH